MPDRQRDESLNTAKEVMVNQTKAIYLPQKLAYNITGKKSIEDFGSFICEVVPY